MTMLLDRPSPRCFRGMSRDEDPQRRLANMGKPYVARASQVAKKLKTQVILAS